MSGDAIIEWVIIILTTVLMVILVMPLIGAIIFCVLAGVEWSWKVCARLAEWRWER
jgi:hypothetical protein